MPHPTSTVRPLLTIFLLLSTGALSSCDELAAAFGWFQNASGTKKLSGENAFRHMKRAYNDVATPPPTAVLDAIDLEIARKQGEEPTQKSAAAQALLKRSIQARLMIDEQSFIRLDPSYFEESTSQKRAYKNSCSTELDLSKLQANRYLIPQVDKIPVRHQGARGTCAAFTGVAALEYAALNPQTGPGRGLRTLDLSEQYFYWSSKPDCQTSNSCTCPGCSQGSWYDQGFLASEAQDDFSIPLERDCEYVRQRGDHDTQHPLENSCKRGALKVDESETFCGFDEMVHYLHQGYALPWASPLTKNWEYNDGLITLADAHDAGQTEHSSGHAYLIVGYRKLPKMPEEGGMCFIIKNSWGTGWGVDGYSCMTLAWMKAVTYHSYNFLSRPQPMVRFVSLDEDLATHEGGRGGLNNDLPDDGADRGDLPPDDVDLDPTPEPAPEPDPGAWQSAWVQGPDDYWYEVESQSQGDHFFVRGHRLESDEPYTLPVRLLKDERGQLIYKGDVVGQWQASSARIGGEITLCTSEWGYLCSLRMRPADGQLNIQFRDDDLRSVQPEEISGRQGKWHQVGIGRNTYGVFVPKDLSDPEFWLNPKTYLRLGSSEPVRFSLDYRIDRPTELGIRLQGQQVGVLDALKPQQTALCSGGFADRCHLLDSGRLTVVPRNAAKR